MEMNDCDNQSRLRLVRFDQCHWSDSFLSVVWHGIPWFGSSPGFVTMTTKPVSKDPVSHKYDHTVEETNHIPEKYILLR